MSLRLEFSLIISTAILRPASSVISMPLLIFCNSLGYFSYQINFSLNSFNALTSICRILSPVKKSNLPTCLKGLCSILPLNNPNRSISTAFSLRFSNVDNIRAIRSFSNFLSTDSEGITVFLSSIKSPKFEPPSIPTGLNNEMGRCVFLKIFFISSTGIFNIRDNSSGSGSLPFSCTNIRETLEILFKISVMCTGILIVLA